MKEHDQVVLTADLPEDGLRAGDVGVIVHVHRQGKAFEIEFLALDGHAIAVASVAALPGTFRYGQGYQPRSSGGDLAL